MARWLGVLLRGAARFSLHGATLCEKHYTRALAHRRRTVAHSTEQQDADLARLGDVPAAGGVLTSQPMHLGSAVASSFAGDAVAPR